MPTSLKSYVLNGPSTVILFDKRDPYQSWDRHMASPGRGGVDLVAVIGTPVYAPTSGRWMHRANNGSAGNSGEFFHDDNPGWRDVFSHLSRYVGATNQHFEQGDVIAYTGNTGGVDQHLHRHLLDPAGNRQNPWDHFSRSSLSATNQTAIKLDTPLPELKKEDLPMARSIRNSLTGTIALTNIDTGLWWELPNLDYVTLLDARGMWDRTKDLDVTDDEYRFFKAVAESARGTSVTVVNQAAAQIDAATIAQAVAENLTARLES
jgi:hypothetical protein